MRNPCFVSLFESCCDWMVKRVIVDSPLPQGAFWGLTVGLLVGCIRMLLDFIYPMPLCNEEDDRPEVLKYVHYLYFSILLSVITLVVVVAVSLATEEPTPEQVRPLNQIE